MNPILKRQFENLRGAWLRETSHLSSWHTIEKNKNYQQIIELGIEVVPLMLEDLRNGLLTSMGPPHWFSALRQLTDANPMLPEHAGYINKLAQDWVKWGVQNGHIQSKEIWDYSFCVWPDETWTFEHGLHQLFNLINAGGTRLTFRATKEEFEQFRSQVSHAGITLREIERIPFTIPERVD